jgi:hypothetical protein
MSNVIVTGGGPPKKRPKGNNVVPLNLSLISAATKDDSCKVATASNITAGNNGLIVVFEFIFIKMENYPWIYMFIDLYLDVYFYV